MPQFFLEKIVNADQDRVCDLFSDYQNYEKLLPQHFPSVLIRSVREHSSVTEEHMNFGGQELIIMAKHVISKPFSHDIFVIGGDAKGSHIKQQFVKISEGTKILVNIDLKLKGKMKISNMFGKNQFEEDYAIILDDFAKIVEN